MFAHRICTITHNHVSFTLLPGEVGLNSSREELGSYWILSSRRDFQLSRQDSNGTSTTPDASDALHAWACIGCGANSLSILASELKIPSAAQDPVRYEAREIFWNFHPTWLFFTRANAMCENEQGEPFEATFLRAETLQRSNVRHPSNNSRVKFDTT